MTRTWHDYPKTEVLVGANRISITVTDGTHVHVQSFVEGEPASRFSLNGKLHYVSAHFYLQSNGSWTTGGDGLTIGNCAWSESPRSAYGKILAVLNSTVNLALQSDDGKKLLQRGHITYANNAALRLEERKDKLRAELREVDAQLNALWLIEEKAAQGEIVSLNEVLK